MDRRYDPHAIEEKWQRLWKETRRLPHARREPTSPSSTASTSSRIRPATGSASATAATTSPPTPSSRFKRMKGFNVLHPDGLGRLRPAGGELRHQDGRAPARDHRDATSPTTTARWTSSASRYDWSREITSCIPDYYRWTQWFFLLLYERGLAYRATGQQWWCPVDKTILANEQVENGPLLALRHPGDQEGPQAVVLQITDYAQRLLDDLGTIDWPEQIKLMQAQLDRPQRGRRGRLRAARAATTSSRSSRRGPTRSSAPPTWCWRRSTRWSMS